MSTRATTGHQKIIVVSGLQSGIGKTLLAEHIVSLVPGIAAVKITMNDTFTVVTDEQSSIMVPGKDTWRLKSRGAGKVVWIQATEKDLREAVQKGLTLLTDSPRILIEGNSVLQHLSPAVAVFVCDSSILTGPIKPSRLTALQMATVILNNMRENQPASDSAVAAFCRKHNKQAPVHTVNIADAAQILPLLRDALSAGGVL